MPTSPEAVLLHKQATLGKHFEPECTHTTFVKLVKSQHILFLKVTVVVINVSFDIKCYVNLQLIYTLLSDIKRQGRGQVVRRIK